MTFIPQFIIQPTTMRVIHPGTVEAIRGLLFQLNFTTVGDVSADYWELTGDIPSGLTFDTNSGRLEGSVNTEVTPRAYSLTVTAYNVASGIVDSESFAVEVLETDILYNASVLHYQCFPGCVVNRGGQDYLCYAGLAGEIDGKTSPTGQFLRGSFVTEVECLSGKQVPLQRIEDNQPSDNIATHNTMSVLRKSFVSSIGTVCGVKRTITGAAGSIQFWRSQTAETIMDLALVGDIATGNANEFNAAQLYEFSTGRLLAVWAAQNGPPTTMAVSDDNGDTWTPQIFIDFGDQGAGIRSYASCYIDSSDVLHVAIEESNTATTPQAQKVYYIKSTDAVTATPGAASFQSVEDDDLGTKVTFAEASANCLVDGILHTRALDIMVDSNGNPHILSGRREDDLSVTADITVSNWDGTQWVRRLVTDSGVVVPPTSITSKACFDPADVSTVYAIANREIAIYKREGLWGRIGTVASGSVYFLVRPIRGATGHARIAYGDLSQGTFNGHPWGDWGDSHVRIHPGEFNVTQTSAPTALQTWALDAAGSGATSTNTLIAGCDEDVAGMHGGYAGPIGFARGDVTLWKMREFINDGVGWGFLFPSSNSTNHVDFGGSGAHDPPMTNCTVLAAFKGTGTGTICMKGSGASDQQFNIWIASGDNFIKAKFGAGAAIDSGVDVTDDALHLVMLTAGPTPGPTGATFYVDDNAGIAGEQGTDLSTANTFIGARDFASGDTHYSNGIIAFVAVLPVLLTVEQWEAFKTLARG